MLDHAADKNDERLRRRLAIKQAVQRRIGLAGFSQNFGIERGLVGKCLNSNASEIEAAAATLLVVVPANPLCAKHRFAALRINSRRTSLVIRRLLMGRE